MRHVHIAIIFCQGTLSMEFHNVIGRKDDIFSFLFNEQMVPYQWAWQCFFMRPVVIQQRASSVIPSYFGIEKNTTATQQWQIKRGLFYNVKPKKNN